MASASGSGGSGALSWLPWILAGASAASGIAGSISSNKQAKTAEQLAREKMAQDAAMQTQDIASKENTLDPFRQQLAQAKDIGQLDLMERASYSPTKLTPSGPYASYVPQMSGGFSYTKSPELTASAAALKRNVMAGRTAPTMTDPNNYGRTAALDLVSLASSGADPATVGGTAPAAGARGVSTAPVTDYLAGATRRGGSGGGGGVRGVATGAASGAALGSMLPGPGTVIGAGVGALTGLLGKHAATAPSDVDVPTATNVLTQAIRQELGREPQPGEIARMLAMQGLKPGDQWVGEQGLTGLLATLRSQNSMRPSYAA